MKSVNIVVLAAGFSRRLEGFNKLLLPCAQNGLLVEQSLAAIELLQKKVQLGQKILVFSDKNVEKLALQHDFTPLYNNNALRGKSASIVVATQNTQKGDLLFVAGDQYSVSAEHLQNLIKTAGVQKAEVVFTEHADGSVGLPAYFSEKLRPNLAQLSAEEGGKEAVKLFEREGNSAKVCTVRAPYPLDCDIDTWDEYLAFLYKHGKRHVLITGEKAIGKTTLLNAILRKIEKKEAVDGLRIYVDREESLAENNLYIERIKTREKKLAACLNKQTKEITRLYKDTFNDFAIKQLYDAVEHLKKEQRQNHKQAFLILDELGRIEKDCEEFLKAIHSVFDDTSLHVLVVLQKGNTAYNESLLQREDIQVLHLES